LCLIVCCANPDPGVAFRQRENNIGVENRFQSFTVLHKNAEIDWRGGGKDRNRERTLLHMLQNHPAICKKRRNQQN